MNKIIHGVKAKQDSKISDYIQDEGKLKELFSECVEV